MSRTDIDDIKLLEAEFAEAMQRMYAVGNGLDAYRRKLEAGRLAVPVAAPPTPEPRVPATPIPEASRPDAARPEAMPGVVPVPPVEPVPPAVPVPPVVPAQGTAVPPPPGVGSSRDWTASETYAAPSPWWQREGMVVRLLGAAGAGVLLIGVALLLRYAIEAGYIGPAARVTLAGILAVGLIGVAARLHRDPQRATGAIAIAGAGYATAYLDLVAVTTVYEWLPAAAGLALAGLVGLSGLVLARAWGSELLAVITVAGAALLTPWVGDKDEVLIAGFLVVLALAAWPAQLGNRWLGLHAVRVAPAALALCVAADGGHHPAILGWAVAFAALELGAAVLVTRLESRTTLLTPTLALSALPLTLAATAAGMRVWIVAAVAAAAYLGAAFLARTRSADGLLAVAPWAGGIGTVYAVIAVGEARLVDWTEPGLLALACAYAAAAHLIPRTWLRWAAVATGVIGLLAFLPILVNVLVKSRAGDLGGADLVASALVVALSVLLPAHVGAVASLVASQRAELANAGMTVPGSAGDAGSVGQAGDAGDAGAAREPGEASNGGAWGWLTWPLLLAGASAFVVTAAVLVGQASDRATGGFVVGHGLATLLWAVAAAYLLMHGLGRSSDASRSLQVGLALAAVAVVKLLFFDFSVLDGIVRIVAFIGAGLVLLAMGTGYAKALERARAGRPATRQYAERSAPPESISRPE